MIRKFKKQFLYKTLTDSRIFGKFGEIEFFKENTKYEFATQQWDQMVMVPSESTLLLLDKIKDGYKIIYKFFYLNEIKIIETLSYQGNENNLYPWFEELSE